MSRPGLQRAIGERWDYVAPVVEKAATAKDPCGTISAKLGSDHPAEFFAVTTECFFDAPHAMRSEYPELYALFRDYFCQDPASWPPFAIDDRAEVQ